MYVSLVVHVFPVFIYVCFNSEYFLTYFIYLFLFVVE